MLLRCNRSRSKTRILTENKSNQSNRWNKRRRGHSCDHDRERANTFLSFISKMINLVLVTVLLLFRRIGAEQIDIIRIQIQEELPAETLLIPSISSARTVQWFSSSLLFQPYFQLKENHSLYTSDHRLDREEFCRRKLCNCSTCSIDLNFFQLFDDRNVTIGRIEILLEGKSFSSSFFFSPNRFRYQRSSTEIRANHCSSVSGGKSSDRL